MTRGRPYTEHPRPYCKSEIKRQFTGIVLRYILISQEQSKTIVKMSKVFHLLTTCDFSSDTKIDLMILF